MADATFLPALPRNHTYLENAAAVVGTGNADSCCSNNNNTNAVTSSIRGDNANSSSRIEIPIVELPFVIFPTETVPLRLYDDRIVAHLKGQIQRGEAARLGLIYHPNQAASASNAAYSAAGSIRDKEERLIGATILQHERFRLGGTDRCFPLGTVATITFTHQQEPNNAAPSGHRQQNVGLASNAGARSRGLVVTAIGTHRFVHTIDHRGSSHRSTVDDDDYDYYDNGGIKMCRVEVIHDEAITSSLVGPYLQHLPKFTIIMKRAMIMDPTTLTLRRLSIVTGRPFLLFHRILAKRWPGRRVMDEIETLLRQSVALKGLISSSSNNNNSVNDDEDNVDDNNNDMGNDNDDSTHRKSQHCRYPSTAVHHDDPEAYSYWLSANLPISQRLKATSLSILSVGERLYFLHRLVRHILTTSSAVNICCRRCRRQIAWGRDIVTVPGADGVSGHYVNPHGVLHQTLTVRRLVSQPLPDVGFWGRWESRDSWFPGYQWLIMSCGTCRNHLGWKFARPDILEAGGVGGSGECATGELKAFYGLSSSQVTTYIEPGSDDHWNGNNDEEEDEYADENLDGVDDEEEDHAEEDYTDEEEEEDYTDEDLNEDLDEDG
jgi:Lon protease-like protein